MDRSCIADCVLQKKNLTDFEPCIEKFVEFDFARHVSNTVVDYKKIIFFLYKKRNFNLLKPLVQASKDKNPKDPNDHERTLLHKAVRDGKLEYVQFIVPLISDKNPKDNYGGFTPLHWAAMLGHLEIVMYLGDQLQDKNPKTDFGTTPLHEAAYYGKTEVTKYLVSVVDDKHPKNKNGRTPLDDARSKGHTDIVKILEKY